jgi:heptaprenyl diphosphate synthase
VSATSRPLAPAARQGEPRGARLAIPEPVLDQLEAHGLPVAGTLAAVEDKLHAQVASSHAFVDEAARYLITAGGKRFRPLMVALTGHLGDATRPELVDAGVIVELVHLATLYHDDVIDEAPARRGTPSANSRWDNTVAILTGDYLFARASELSADLGVEVTRIMARTLAALCEGQIQEVQGSLGALPPDVPQLEPTIEHYLRVIGGKTASLIATSCRYGALLSGRRAGGGGGRGRLRLERRDGLPAVRRHPRHRCRPGGLGQDAGHRPARGGADPAGALRAGGGPGRAARDPARRGARGRRHRRAALALLRDSDALERSRATAADYVAQAVGHLDRFDGTPVVTALTRLAEYAVDRVG